MSLVAASLAAAAFGTGDFLGGLAARRTNWQLVIPVSLATGLPVLAAAGWWAGDRATTLPVIWCLVAGLGFAAGVSLIYRALATGRMTQVAPITAVVAIIIPACADMLTGKAVTAPLLLGLGAAGLSASLLSGLGSGWRDIFRDRAVILGAVGAGIGFALFYIGLDRIDAAGGGIRAILLARTIAFAVTAAVALRRGSEGFGMRGLGIAACAGLLDGAANFLLMIAFAAGGLAEVSAVASLYPVATVLLAVAVLREQPSFTQTVGLVLTIPAIFILRAS